MNLRFSISLGLLMPAMALAQSKIDLKEVEAKLKGDGQIGWIHGAVKDRALFVFTVRNPNDFFDHIEFPMVSPSPAITQQLKTLHRHDKVRIKGEFVENFAPIKHIEVNEVKVLTPFVGAPGSSDYSYGTEIPKDLLSKTEITVRVHAVAEEGKVVVIEYGDQVVPVAVRDNSVTKNLYRGDKIKLRYLIRKKPNQPTHLTPDPQASQPIEVLEAVVEGHGKSVTKEGVLVMFPKSPQVAMNIFALQSLDSDGVALEYTLVNFDDSEVFMRILAKLQAAWDKVESRSENGRNKRINRTIRVKASGMLNMVDPGQANPQILLKGPEDIQLDALP